MVLMPSWKSGRWLSRTARSLLSWSCANPPATSPSRPGQRLKTHLVNAFLAVAGRDAFRPAGTGKIQLIAPGAIAETFTVKIRFSFFLTAVVTQTHYSYVLIARLGSQSKREHSPTASSCKARQKYASDRTGAGEPAPMGADHNEISSPPVRGLVCPDVVCRRPGSDRVNHRYSQRSVRSRDFRRHGRHRQPRAWH